MIARRLSLPGNFVEAFLYFDFLWLISAEGDTWAFDIQHFIDAKFSDQSIAENCTIAYARNDYIKRSFVNFELESVPQNIEVSRSELEKFSRIFDTRLDFGSVLDVRCYYGRMFLATESNIRQLTVLNRSDLAHVSLGFRANGQMGGDLVHDGRCVQFRCQHGIISAACAYDGGFYAAGASAEESSWRAKFVQFSTHSLATEFVADKLTNLPDVDNIEFYGTNRHDMDHHDELLVHEELDSDTEQYEITEVEKLDRELGNRANQAILGEDRRHADEISRVFLSKSALFAVDFNHVVRSIRLVDGQDFVQQPKASRPFPPAKGPILSMTASAVGMIAELDDEVAVLSKGKWHTIFNEPVYSIRGYPSSKWYRSLMTAVGEERTDLIFLKT